VVDAIPLEDVQWTASEGIIARWQQARGSRAIDLVVAQSCWSVTHDTPRYLYVDAISPFAQCGIDQFRSPCV